jgi:hypothetical protein
VPDVDVVLPAPGRRDAATLVARLRAAQAAMPPFAPELVAFTAELSRRLRRSPAVRAQPALGALAFWIRPANLERLRAAWEQLPAPGTLRVPRGVVLHIPPTNVDTLFVYSWLLSALAGNANVVRLSPSAVATPSPLLGILGDLLAEPGHAAVAATTALVTYGHDDAVTAALSTGDVRVVWGGDGTVAAVRAVPLPPHATELAFADRHSLAALDAAAVAALDDAALAELAGRFYADAYWFDQLGCASPRLVVWRGTAGDAERAAARFYAALGEEVARRGYETPTGAVLAKLVHASDVAAAGALAGLDWSRNELTVARLHGLDEVARDGPGAGLFYDARVDDLAELVPVVVRRDQTLSTFGIAGDELRALARALNGRGIDRMVPIGRALAFDRHWDGWDLLAAFSRGVAVDDDPTGGLPR